MSSPRNQSTRRVGLAVVAACTAGAIDCGPPVVEYDGHHVVVLADPGLELCGGSLAQMDDFVARLASAWDVELPMNDERLEFRWFRKENAAFSPCPAHAFGCAVDDSAFAVSAPLNHELVHALASRHGYPPAFFEEGLAYAFQGLEVTDATYSGVTVGESMTVWEALPTRPKIGSSVVASGFVARLIERHGLASFLAIYASLSHSASVGEVDQVFRAVLDTTLAASVEDFEKSAGACTRAEFDAKLVECNAPPIPWDGSRLEVFRQLNCAQPDAVGPYDGKRLQVFHTIEVREAGLFEVHVIGQRPEGDNSAPISAVLTPCGGCGAVVEVEVGRRVRAPLLARPYSLRLVGPATTPTSVGVLLERVADSDEGPP